MKEEIAEIDNHLAHIVDYTVNWYQMLKNKYGKNFPRRTELELRHHRSCQSSGSERKTLYTGEEGFIGTSLKKDEFVACCSDIDDVIIFFRDGKYIVTPVADKKFVGKTCSMSMYSRRTTSARFTTWPTVTEKKGQRMSNASL